MEKFDFALRLACFLASATFVAKYLFVRWWKSQEGWHLLMFGTVICGFTGLTVAVQIWGFNPIYTWIARLFFAMLFALLVQRIYLLIRAQRTEVNRRASLSTDQRLTENIERRESPMEAIKPYAKAVVGGLTAFAGAVAVGYNDGNMTTGEWWSSAAAGLVALGIVFGVPNKGTQETSFQA